MKPEASYNLHDPGFTSIPACDEVCWRQGIACMSDDVSAESKMAGQLDALRNARDAAARPDRGWLRAVRTALGLSQAHVAARSSMTRQAYADLEAAEERGAISLNSLRRAAEAMGAEFVYCVAPRAEVPAIPAPGSGADPVDDDLPVELR